MPEVDVRLASGSEWLNGWHEFQRQGEVAYMFSGSWM